MVKLSRRLAVTYVTVVDGSKGSKPFFFFFFFPHNPVSWKNIVLVS